MPTIDADAHVIETERTWDYMDGADAEFRPVLAAPSVDGKKDWLIDGKIYSRGGNVNRKIPEASRELSDIELRLRHMDELGIDIQVLYPSLFLRPLTARPEVEQAISRSYNRWLADIWRKGERRLPWVAVIPMMNIDAAIAEARFAKENGGCGLFTRGLVEDKRLSDPYFFPLYEEAEKLDLPICIHASTGNFDWVDLFSDEGGFSKFKLPVLSAFHSLVFEGVPDKFPRLRFAFIEIRAQWIPYLMIDLRKRFVKLNRPVGPDLMRANRLYVTCQTDDDLPYILKYSGEDNIVIGSDYGHVDSAAEIDALRNLKDKGEIEPRIIDKILYDNSKALYGL
ncbi:MAG TPA: amidohydrolase family protein [Candidatus Binatia bacterium]|jgi:predicted TIM-barrel fold metal-dependent hydrolase